MNPWPMAWFVTAGGKKVKVTECAWLPPTVSPGTVLSTKPLTVACADGAVQLLHVVPEGKKPMDGTSFAAGSAPQSGGYPLMAANPRAAAVAALVRQEQDGFSNLVLDAELRRQKLEGRDKAFAGAIFYTVLEHQARWISFWNSSCPRALPGWTRRCARSCGPRWRRPAICRCRCRRR